jgi:hypothetical protein
MNINIWKIIYIGDALTIFPPSEATFRICVDAKYFN